MKITKTNVLTPMWVRAQKLLEENNLEEADEALMALVWKIADYTMDGLPDEHKVEGVKIGVWKERAWIAIQDAGLLPD